ncbi:MAG: hypothetical protein K9N51_05295 [Candidatus Pacebacteria bacterium]|nr:hypothetical protein [Candidatus Paceibacterota bacterium]
MKHSLSFWEEPDWRRESTISPTFLGGILLCIMLLGGLAMASYVFTVRISRRAELERVKLENKQIAGQAERVKKRQETLQVWGGNLEQLHQLTARTMLWSRQLEALQSVVPMDITLTQLNITANEVQVDLPREKGAAPKQVSKTQYVLTLSGVARGERAQETITEFSDELPRNPEIGRQLINRELKNISGARGGKAKTFTIVCIYRPVG